MKTTIALALISVMGQQINFSVAEDIIFDRGHVILTNGKKKIRLNIEIADDFRERSLGLMNRSKLEVNSGMLFVFEKLSQSGFWMKNTLIPLSIAFFDDKGTILDIIDMEPCKSDPCKIYTPKHQYIGAIEVNKGIFAKNNIKVGWNISYTKIK